MEHILELIDKTENYLTRISSESAIDLNNPLWQKIAQESEETFIQAALEPIQELRKQLFAKIEVNERTLADVGAKLKMTTYVKRYIQYRVDEIELLNKHAFIEILPNLILIFILLDMSGDPRDSILYLNRIIQILNNKNIPYKPVINKLKNYASTDIHYGVNLSTFDVLSQA